MGSVLFFKRLIVQALESNRRKLGKHEPTWGRRLFSIFSFSSAGTSFINQIES